MARVEASVDYAELEGDYGEVEGIIVTCERCGHSVEVYGTSEASERRGGVMLAEECPRGERNFYVVGGDVTLGESYVGAGTYSTAEVSRLAALLIETGLKAEGIHDSRVANLIKPSMEIAVKLAQTLLALRDRLRK